MFQAFFFCNHRHRGIGLHFLGPSKNDVQSIHPSIAIDSRSIYRALTFHGSVRGKRKTRSLAASAPSALCRMYGGGPALSLSLSLTRTHPSQGHGEAESAIGDAVRRQRGVSILARVGNCRRPSAHHASFRVLCILATLSQLAKAPSSIPSLIAALNRTTMWMTIPTFDFQCAARPSTLLLLPTSQLSDQRKGQILTPHITSKTMTQWRFGLPRRSITSCS